MSSSHPIPIGDTESTVLLHQALSGDRDAFDTLFTRLWPVVVGTVSSKIKALGGSMSVEDVAQNILIYLLENNARRLRNYSSEKGMLESYIAKIAHNYSIDILRKHAGRIQNIDISTLPEPVDEEISTLPMVEPWEITAALETLTVRERQVIALLYEENLETADAAERLGVSPDTIRSEKSHALRKLRKFFGQE